ncbi:NAD-dependent epimerase/dehydratase family protein [Microbacterium sp. SORGH_AS_0862]|uniref:NAD-dependent epimerase/dehydratase family protein n=1 Tax=Microbacterium sp. SORGH_AS_0862 TaxID=3041789 RepID=UPI0027905DCE|nr:NAD-dependent epimerase/dehydratase family protein [Microbacterium sp. SORGH_AS_0862]MDQ1206387.1 dihydroflavonol-4-reductase [Microbacterium sp. SORGH_AS_0862]
MQRALVVGGTGLLGYHTTQELLRRGYRVATLALPATDAPELPIEVDAHWGDVNLMTDGELADLLTGTDAVFFAMGADERTLPPAPASRFYYEANVVPTQRLARLARAAGVERFIVFGSDTAEWGERWPELGFRTRNAYPRSRYAQEEVAVLEGDGAMDVMVLRLPYIFGVVAGQRPRWQAVLDAVAASAGPIPVLGGSTSAVTVRQVAQAAVGAMERGTHGSRYTLSAYELSHSQFLELCCEAVGRDPHDVAVVPLRDLLTTSEAREAEVQAVGREFGLHPADTALLGEKRAVGDVADTIALDVEPDDVLGEIRACLAWCVEHPRETVPA